MNLIEPAESQRANRRFIKEAMAAPILSAEHEMELATRWRLHKDQAALHELITAYMRLVVALAGRYRNYGLPTTDLIQEGNVGLMQAAERFDPERGVRFSTYAGWWVRAAIQDYILRNWSIVRTGTTTAQKSLFFNLRRLKARLHHSGAPYMSAETRGKVAHRLKVPLADVEAMEARMQGPDASLNSPLSDAEDGEGSEWQDFLASSEPLPDETTMALHDTARRRRWLERALATLSDRERLIIRKRRLAEKVTTLEVLGRRLGISKERVRQIEGQALKKLKTALMREVPDPLDAGLVPT
jgi:RNA polymerase sigma-32 factor